MKITYFELETYLIGVEGVMENQSFKRFEAAVGMILMANKMHQKNNVVYMVHITIKEKTAQIYGLNDMPKDQNFITITNASLAYILRVMSKIQRDISEIWIGEYTSYEDAFSASTAFYEPSRFCYSE